VIWIFVFKRELLIRDDSFRLILAVSLVLFLVGIVLHFTDAGRRSFCGSLLSPLPSLGLFRLSRRLFLKRFEKEARDTYLIWDAGMAADRIFNIAYFSLAGLLLMLTTIGMLELAKAGL